jgi:hypothetical protein
MIRRSGGRNLRLFLPERCEESHAFVKQKNIRLRTACHRPNEQSDSDFLRVGALTKT